MLDAPTDGKTSFFARGHFFPPLSFAGLFARLNLAESLLTVDIIYFTEAGEVGPNKLFIFFVRGYLERSKYGPLTYAMGTQVTV